MARSSKRSMLDPQTIIPDQGVNFGKAPVDLLPTELANSQNGYYPKQSGRWTVRPGFEAVTSNANALSSAIMSLETYYDGTTNYLVAASGGKLHKMTKTVLESNPAWTEVGSLADSSTKPSMQTYNGRLCIADGGTSVRYWDGTTYGLLSNSPTSCTSLDVARGRLIGNSGDAADYVYMSSPNLVGTDWQFESNHLSIAAGWGDGLSVNGLAVGPGGIDMVVSKSNGNGRSQLRRLLMADADPSNWYVSDPTDSNTGAQNAQGIVSAFGDTYYFDDVGIRRVRATDTYAEIQPDPRFGDRLNKVFQAFSAEPYELTYLPTVGALMILVKDHPQQYLYFPRNDAFMPWRLGGVVITSVCTLDGVIYLGSSDGNLYRMTEGIGTDEVEPGEMPQQIESYLRSKKIVAGGYDMALLRTTVAMTPISSGTAAVFAIRNDERSNVQVGADFDIDDGMVLIGLDTQLVGASDSGLIGESGAEPTQQTVRGGPRTKGIQIEIRGYGARFEVEFITAELSGPLGG